MIYEMYLRNVQTVNQTMKGIEWKQPEWNGMERTGMEWNGMEWN